jgi:antitoxin MazE
MNIPTEEASMPKITVGKWGNNLAVRLPKEIANAVGLTEGSAVEIEARSRDIVIRPAAPRFTLDKLFHGKTPAQWRAEYADAFDWGPDVGREVVEE